MPTLKLLFPFFLLSTIVTFLSCHQGNKQDQLSPRAIAKLYPDEYLFSQRAYPFLEAEYGNITRSFFKSRSIASFTNRRFVESWKSEGPTNVNGRVVDIEGVIESDKTILYVASASGGIFKTEDDGTEWTPIFDDQLTLAIGDMDISKSNPNTIYVGTGEANAGGGSLAYDGNGIYKSTDAGNTWIHLGLTSIGSVGKIAIHPTNDDIVYVAAMGKLFSNNEQRGVYKTINGGQTWEKVFYISDQTGAIDLVINPSDPNVLYAAMWDRIRTPSNRTYGGINSGIYKTLDGGSSWERQESDLPINSEIGRIGLAISQLNTSILYATISNSDGTQEGIYSTENAGLNWTQKSAVGVQTVPFMWWFGKIYIHPNSPSQLFHPGFVAQFSNDSGNSFTNVFQGAHVDQHAMWFHPTEPNTIYLANDGGVYKSTTLGQNHYKLPNLPNVQFYTCEIDNLNPERLYGGTQDNNTIRTLNGENDDYRSILGGDGFRVLVDPTNSDNIYAEYQYGVLFRSTDGQSFDYALNGVDDTDRNNWNSPVAIDPNDPTTLYFGTHRIYKTENKAVSWNRISDDLSKGENLNGNLRYGTTTSIDVSPYNGDYILVGTDDGNIQLTTDGGDNWSLLSASLPNRWVTAVLFDPNDSEVVYATFSGFRYGEDISNAYRSTDLGQTWSSITPDFYEGPINDILIVPENGLKIIATDIGVFTSLTDSDEWELLGNELPNVVITDIDYHVDTRTLVAATFGRGLFSYEFSDPLNSNNYTNDISINLYPNPASQTIRLSSSGKISLVEIYNLQGQKIHSGTEQVIDVTSFNTGIYYLKAKTNLGVVTKKVVIE